MAYFPCNNVKYDLSELVPAIPLTLNDGSNPARYSDLGLTVSASDYYTYQNPSYAFNFTNRSGFWGTNNGLVHWLKVAFDDPVEIKVLVYICLSGGGIIKFQYSDDDTNWTDTDWEYNNPAHMDSSMGFIKAGAHRYWRFYCSSDTNFTPGIRCILYK